MNIQKLWDSWIDAGIFSGVFFVIDESGVLFEKQCGFRNLSEKLPNNITTAFSIASGTKLFTGLAACKLIDAGKLSLDAKLWDILPYDLGQVSKRVTVRHLLTHTSGIGITLMKKLRIPQSNCVLYITDILSICGNALNTICR
jgi:CubicO group peptidase (beta-lactamase class C family)